jgi:hypothetical protein
MDRNNPVWREYLKAIIRIQIDAGVDGIQLDEAELPITTFQYGGCFCKECMRGFTNYLKKLPAEILPAEICDIDLSTFHYGKWLLEQGYDFKNDREETPLFWEYHRFQMGQIKRYFGELAHYARQYAASKGRGVLVSGNFFNLVAHWYYAMEPDVDLIITEMRNTRYRQPAWYRYVAGFAGNKPVIVAENPYGGVIPELIEMLKVGKGYDLFRMSLYEAAAMGANMSVPYGSWMGSVIQDSFYAPHELCVEIQSFLADHEQLFSRKTWSDIGVIYSVETNFLRTSGKGLFADNRYNTSTSEVGPFWQVCEQLSDAAQPYDIIFFPDGTLRPDSLTLDQLGQYNTLILPDCRFLTRHQADLLSAYLERGGHLLVLGGLGTNLPEDSMQTIVKHKHTTTIKDNTEFNPSMAPHGMQVEISPEIDLAINIQKVDQGAAIHLLRYDYDPAADGVAPLEELKLSIRLPNTYDHVQVFGPGEKPEASLTIDGDKHSIVLNNVPLYTILLLT